MARSAGKPAAAVAHVADDDGDVTPPGFGEELVARGKVLAKTQAGYTTAIAVQQPRNIMAVRARVTEEAAMLGEDFIYGWKVRDKNSPTGWGTIEGVSIDGAMILVRNWGNCVTPIEIEEDAPGHWVFRATFIDLETGYTSARLFRQRKGEKHMTSKDGDRLLDIAFQIGQSKAIRNVVVKAMPSWLTSAARESALNSAVAKFAKDLPKSIQTAIDHFAKLDVTPEMLERKVGLPKAAWTARDVADLSALYRAIAKEKVTTVHEAFVAPFEEPEQTKPSATTGTDDKEEATATSQPEGASGDTKPSGDDDSFGGNTATTL